MQPGWRGNKLLLRPGKVVLRQSGWFKFQKFLSAPTMVTPRVDTIWISPLSAKTSPALKNPGCAPVKYFKKYVRIEPGRSTAEIPVGPVHIKSARPRHVSSAHRDNVLHIVIFLLLFYYYAIMLRSI